MFSRLICAALECVRMIILAGNYIPKECVIREVNAPRASTQDHWRWQLMRLTRCDRAGARHWDRPSHTIGKRVKYTTQQSGAAKLNAAQKRL